MSTETGIEEIEEIEEGKEDIYEVRLQEMMEKQQESFQEKLDELNQTYDTHLAEVTAKKLAITEYLTAVQVKFTAATTTAQNINTTYTNNSAKLKESQDAWNLLKDEYSETTKEQQLSHDTKLKVITDKLSTLQKEAEAVLDISTSAGLAKSYHEKIKGISEEINGQKLIFIVANLMILCISIFGFWGFSSLEFEGIESMYRMLFHSLPTIAMVSPLLWIAKQNGELLRQNIRIREEYEHKKSLVTTYNGYKNSLLETLTDEHMHADERHPISSLIEDTTKGIMRNPSDDIYAKEESMPYEDLLKILIKVPSDKFENITSILLEAMKAHNKEDKINKDDKAI